MNWPVIIKHSDDAELIYVSKQSEWIADADVHDFEYDESDYLVDSFGNLFSLTTRDQKYVTPVPRGETMALPEVLGLVKAHAAQQGSCCVSKLYASTIVEALEIVKSLNET